MDTTKRLLEEIVEMEYYCKHGYDSDYYAGYLYGLKCAYQTVTDMQDIPATYFKNDGTFVVVFCVGLTEDYDELMEYVYGTYFIDDDDKIHVKFKD